MASLRTRRKLLGRLVIRLLAAVLFIAMTAWLPRVALAASPAQETTGDKVRLLIKVDPTFAGEAQISALSQVESHSTSHSALLDHVNWEVIEVDAAQAPQVMAELQATQGVVEVTQDYPLELAWKPSDPAIQEGDQWSIDTIRADIAWEFSSGQAITVAVIDSGIDPNHPDLVNRIVPGYNFIDDNTDTGDLCGHGTHVAGIIAAEADNGVGVAGVAHQAVIMPVKVIGDNCLGSYSRLMQGILYAVDNGARIISITSGGGFEHTGLHDAIIYARNKGVFVAVAAGNRGNNLDFYPGSFAEAFTVAGTDSKDQKYTMSNYGEQIDIAAPAVGIYSTYWKQEEGSTYAYMTGTSMAAPHVAAVAALVLAIDPKLSLEDLESVLTGSATDLGDAGWDPIFGWGRLTAWRAVAAVSPATGNVRLGHIRVPKMAAAELGNVTMLADMDSIDLSWTMESFTGGESVVIYRSPVPVFEAAEDVAEVEAAASVSYTDMDVAADQEYFYWLVQADNDVEVASTEVITAKLATAPLAPAQPEVPEAPQTPEAPTEPKEPQKPQEPSQPVEMAMFMPFLQR